MRLKLFLIIFLCVLQNIYAERSNGESETTEDTNTKKSSGFFGGIKNFFSGSPSKTTTISTINIEGDIKKTTPTPSHARTSTIPSIALPKAPLIPLGPRPNTPDSSASPGAPSNPFQWPQSRTDTLPSSKPVHPTAMPNEQPLSSSGRGAQKMLPPGFSPYHPPKPQPSGLDLSYGQQPSMHNNVPKQLQPGHDKVLSGISTTTTTTTTTTKPYNNQEIRSTTISTINTTKKPQTPKEDFPALPSSKDPTTTTISNSPGSTSAWNKPLKLPDAKSTVITSTSTIRPHSIDNEEHKNVDFVPHVSRTTTTVRPGFETKTNSLATDNEIRTLTEQLYQKESNNLLSSIEVHLQGKTRSIDSTDEAPQPLLKVDEKVFDTNSISKMRLLFNNYESDTTVNEHVTPNERKEENDFLDIIMSSNIMRHTMQFLQNKGLVTPDPKTHRDLVKELWFTQYSRGQGKIGSSGFEHVFVNEVKNGTIIGLHNWVYFYEEEKANRLDYKGYLKDLNLGNKARVVKVRFTHNGLNKPVNTLFIGTSPELEFALYTLCFKLRADTSCPVSLGDSKFSIVTYSWRYRGKNLIGSAFPEI